MVLVALSDPVLDATTRELKKAYPKVQLRKVPAPLTGSKHRHEAATAV